MVAAGVFLLVWAFTVWRWEDPFTSLYTTWEQRKLDSELATRIEDGPRSTSPPGESPQEALERVRAEARRFRDTTADGEAIGRLRVPQMGVNMVVVDGTDSHALKRGPGRDGRTFMPGEGKLVYIAGHRTTYGAPFARIDELERGDRVTLEMPYGTFVYVVSRSRIVDDQDLSVLATGRTDEVALQACHPRFFASQRYIVWAKPLRTAARDGRRYAIPESARR
jgi:sortase A